MVCRIKNRHTFKSLPILNLAYFTECRFVIRHITQTDTETETEANFTHLSTDDPNFIGAWWLGFLVIGITALIGLLPLFFFPEHMAEYYSRVDTQPKKNESTKENTLMSTIKGKTYYSE